MSVLEEITRLAALGTGLAAVLAGALALVVTRRMLTAVGVLLDLLLAAGLLRLVGDPGWQAILTAAGILALRRLVGAGLRMDARKAES